MKRLAWAILLAGCVSGERGSADLAAKAPPPPPPPVAALPPPPDGGPPDKLTSKLPERAEVELSGTLTLPKGNTGEVEMWVTDGACWKKGTHAIARSGVGTDRWGVEVLVPQGTQLWVCARVVPKGTQKATVHGEAGPFLGKGVGEVIFSQLKIELKSGAPVEPPPPPPLK